MPLLICSLESGILNLVASYAKSCQGALCDSVLRLGLSEESNLGKRILGLSCKLCVHILLSEVFALVTYAVSSILII